MNDFKICCFSGHRRIPADKIMKMPALLDRVLDELVKNGFRTFRTGGAIGFDTLCALKCLELKKKYPELKVKLELCLPCRNQTDGWSEQEKSAYNFVLRNADKVTYEQELYSAGCMHARNRRLVNGAHTCVTYLSSNTGGTAYTCNYAKENGVEVINLFNML